jgi:transcriptional regulator with XRE-family HTH domain
VSDRFYSAVGERIREARLRAGLSQDEVARRGRLNRFFVSRVETGAENLSLQSLGRFALALGVTPAQLLEGVEADEGLLAPRPRKNSRDPGLRSGPA